MRQNEDLRQERDHVSYSAIALQLKVSESTVYRWFRSQISPERKNEILTAIKEIKAEDRDINLGRCNKR